jgi:hypothetical protein
VHVQIAAEIRHLDELRQLATTGGLQLAGGLA